MKKTLAIAALLMTGIAAADTVLDDATAILDGSNLTLDQSFKSAESYKVTIGLDLDVATLANCLTLEASETTLVSWSIAGNDISWNTNITETTTGFKTVLGSTSRSLSGNTADGHHLADGFQAIEWENITGAALTIVLSGNSGIKTCGFLTLEDADGNYHEYYASDAGLGWSGADRELSNITIANSDLVNVAYVYDSAYTMANAQKLNKTIIASSIPEPTTATLSLLALAGLAARRRRK